jgi:hypothetical protein
VGSCAFCVVVALLEDLRVLGLIQHPRDVGGDLLDLALLDKLGGLTAAWEWPPLVDRAAPGVGAAVEFAPGGWTSRIQRTVTVGLPGPRSSSWSRCIVSCVCGSCLLVERGQVG